MYMYELLTAINYMYVYYTARLISLEYNDQVKTT